MRYAIINDQNIVINVVLSESAMHENWIADTESAAMIGMIFEDGQFKHIEG